MAAACVVAVVVAYHPEQNRLTQLLARLAPQVAHTVVVDNTDCLPPATLQPNAQLTQLQLGHNTGIAHAQNLGIAGAKQLGATHVLLMDQDSLPPPDLVAQLLAAWARDDAAQIAAMGPLCRDEKSGSLMPLIQRQGWRIHRSVPITATAHVADADVNVDVAEASAPERPGGASQAASPQACSPAPIAVEYIPASGTLLSLAALEHVGPMQADYFIDRVDAQWCLRARQLGLAICVNPAVEMAHNQATRNVRLLGRTLYVGHDFRAYFHVRNSLAMALRARIPAFWRMDQLLKLPAYMLLHIAVAQHGRWRMAGLMAAAVWDGLHGHMGLGRFRGRPLR